MSIILENEFLLVRVNEKGAELTNVQNKIANLEYMWSGDPKIWGKTSPILFPIVGTLKSNTFLYNGQSYELTRHGFARDQTFGVEKQTATDITFFLESTADSREKYPFDFRLNVRYKIEADLLEVTYVVTNSGNSNMYFSLGAHPAFKVPLVDHSTFEDHVLKFEVEENAPRWPINSEGLITAPPVPFLSHTSTLKLNHLLFMQDALVFKKLRSKMISIMSETHDHGLDFYFDGFPFFALWSAKNANFVCLEPWCGIADSVTHDQDLVHKEGIINLLSGEQWTRAWKVRFY